MTYVVTGNCQRCKYTDCVEVCPVDAFYEMESQLVINPEECIDCDACVPECPVEAIYWEGDLRPEDADWLKLNAAWSQEAPVIVERKEPLPTADERRRQLGFR